MPGVGREQAAVLSHAFIVFSEATLTLSQSVSGAL